MARLTKRTQIAVAAGVLVLGVIVWLLLRPSPREEVVGAVRLANVGDRCTFAEKPALIVCGPDCKRVVWEVSNACEADAENKNDKYVFVGGFRKGNEPPVITNCDNERSGPSDEDYPFGERELGFRRVRVKAGENRKRIRLTSKYFAETTEFTYEVCVGRDQNGGTPTGDPMIRFAR